MNLKELKELFRLVEKTDFTELELSQGDLRLRIERGKSPTILAAPGQAPAVSSDVSSGSAPTSSSSTKESESESKSASKDVKEESGRYQYVTSPFVGTFYRAPSPDTDPYTDVGKTIRKGQPLCIVEAMKLMNEIESDFDGKVVEILVDNATPVEFGEKLFKIEAGS